MENWTSRRRIEEENYEQGIFNSKSSEMDYHRDRARIIHSAAFRRLQSKTQVLGLGENDFYRTRLTHTLEVFQIASGLLDSLREKHTQHTAIIGWLPTNYLLESICLAHDIGHPPFGHGGEVALNYMMKDYGGFEGNAQTLRIISKLGEYSPLHGFDLTRRTMLGTIKYPALYSRLFRNPLSEPNPDSNKLNNPINLDNWKPPKCIYDEDEHVLNWILKPFEENDKHKFIEYVQIEKKHSKTKYKSLDTSIMEIADDISYGVHDLEDALALKMIDYKIWNDQVVPHILKLNTNPIKDKIDFYNEKLFSDSSKDRKHAISKLINYFISNVEIQLNEIFVHPLLKYNAVLHSEAKSILDRLQILVIDNVIKQPEVQTLEYKGQQMIIKLFEVIKENPKRTLPVNTFEKYDEHGSDMRTLCDYIAGMTDSYATKLYSKIFIPSMGSIFDRL